MTERDLFIKEIPLIAEMIVQSREMSNEQCEQWKKESLEQAELSGVRDFVAKIFIVIEKFK